MDMKMYDIDGYIHTRRVVHNTSSIKEEFSVDLDEGIKKILLKHLSPERAFMIDTELRELFSQGNSDNVQNWCNSKSEIEFPIFEIKDSYSLDRI